MNRGNHQHFKERCHFHFFSFFMYYGSTRGLFALVSRKTILLSVLLKSDLCITFSFPQKAMLISKRNIFSFCFLLFQHNLQVGFISLMFHVVKKLENVSAQLIQALQFIHALFHAANVIWCMNIKTGFKSWRIQQYASAQFRSYWSQLEECTVVFFTEILLIPL